MASIGSATIEQKINYDICKNQANIYELFAENGYDMEQFSNLYLKSNFCNNSFDKVWSLYHATAPEECMPEIIQEFGENLEHYSDNMSFDPDIAWWIGFTYRQLQIETGLSSKDLSDIISFIELCNCYPGLHTIDEEWATDIICEKHNLKKIA